jgi:hypothetical protein
MPAGAIEASYVVEIAALSGFETAIFDSERCAHALCQYQGRDLQLAIWGLSSIHVPHQLFVECSVAPSRLRGFIGAYSAFNALAIGRKSRPQYGGPDGNSRRFALSLMALDYWITGASLRETAIALFGHRRVGSDWNGDSDYLKSQVRRLVKRGRWLMLGGYRTLLR